ncbi:Hypothetical predicted protein [Mytilus galloprovincialis]|uniref:Uncharacterized protein n=1 Tax=Mytilus galloprovincialis TaxID=29158 RepID=A0A8B6ESY1_MYTGA|nr:Hypothetical predicted protein [Mytilus galloprovincialis]
MDSLTLNSMKFIGKLKAGVNKRRTRKSYFCTLCKDDFKDPRLLNCYHSFCRFCLDEYLMVNYEDGNFPCPLCKEMNIAPVNGCRGLPKNEYIKISDSSSPINCDLCEHKIKADSVCKDCNTNLCKSCLISHISMQGSKYHNVISLGKGKEQIRTCSIHPKEELLYYCDTCEKPICHTCNTTEHKTHRSKDIASMATILREQLGTSLKTVTSNTYANDFQNKVAEQKRKIKAYQEDVIAMIDERTKELHRLVNEIRGEFVRKVVNENEENIKQLENNMNTLNTNVASIEELLKLGNIFLQHAYNIDIVVHTPKLQKQFKKLQRLDVQISEIKLKHFSPSQTGITDFEIEKIFGTFDKLNKRPKHIQSISRLSELRRSYYDEDRRTKSIRSHRSFDVSSSSRCRKAFWCSEGTVTGLALLRDGSVCVCLGGEGILETFTITGLRIGHKKFHHPIDDLVAARNGSLYISSNSEKRIFKLVKENKEIFAETRSCVRGLAIDFDENLIAGMTEKGSFFDRHQVGHVTEISKAHKVKRVVNDNKIRYPARIAIGQNRRIVVSDWIQLSVFICNGDIIIGTYSGIFDSEQEFIPRGVCCCENGDIVVVDISTNCLHWLSPEGRLRRVVPLDNQEAWSVTADQNNTVWIGTNNGYVFPVELLS